MNTPSLLIPDDETLKTWARGQTLYVPALDMHFTLTNDWPSARSGDHPEAYRVGEAWLSRDTQYLPRLNFRVAQAVAQPARAISPQGFISGVFWHDAKAGIQVRRDGYRAFPPARRKQADSLVEQGKLVIRTRHPRTQEAINRLAERLGLTEQALLLDALYAGLNRIAATRLDNERAEAFIKAFNVTHAVDKAPAENDQDPFGLL